VNNYAALSVNSSVSREMKSLPCVMLVCQTLAQVAEFSEWDNDVAELCGLKSTSNTNAINPNIIQTSATEIQVKSSKIANEWPDAAYVTDAYGTIIAFSKQSQQGTFDLKLPAGTGDFIVKGHFPNCDTFEKHGSSWKAIVEDYISSDAAAEFDPPTFDDETTFYDLLKEAKPVLLSNQYANDRGTVQLTRLPSYKAAMVYVKDNLDNILMLEEFPSAPQTKTTFTGDFNIPDGTTGLIACAPLGVSANCVEDSLVNVQVGKYEAGPVGPAIDWSRSPEDAKLTAYLEASTNLVITAPASCPSSVLFIKDTNGAILGYTANGVLKVSVDNLTPVKASLKCGTTGLQTVTIDLSLATANRGNNIVPPTPDTISRPTCTVQLDDGTTISKNGDDKWKENGSTCRCSLGQKLCDAPGPKEDTYMTGAEIAVVATSVSVFFFLLIFIAIFCYKKHRAGHPLLRAKDSPEAQGDRGDNV